MQAKLARRSHGAVAELRWLIWQVPFGSFCATTLLYIRIIYGYVYLYCITKCFVFLSYFLVINVGHVGLSTHLKTRQSMKCCNSLQSAPGKKLPASHGPGHLLLQLR